MSQNHRNLEALSRQNISENTISLEFDLEIDHNHLSKAFESFENRTGELLKSDHTGLDTFHSLFIADSSARVVGQKVP